MLRHNRHGGDLVDVLQLWNFDGHGRLVVRGTPSLYRNKHRGNLVDVLRLQNLGILGHLVEESFVDSV